MENLFSYGTLQLETVQKDTFGRKLEGYVDYLIGYKLTYIEIIDETVIASSGTSKHPIITYTNDENDTVKGTVFSITEEELAQADKYEVEDYKRVIVSLQSGKKSWVYVSNSVSEL